MKIKKILISQPKPASEKSPYYDLAEKFGVEMVFHPFIKVEGLSAREFRQQKVSIPEFTAIIFTAKTAVDHFFRLCEEMRLVMPDTMKYFCTTESIALYLQKYIVFRKRKIFSAKTGKLADLMPFIVKHKNERYIFAVSDVSNGDDSKMLDDAKIRYERAVMYRTVPNDFPKDKPFDYDMLVFFSPQGINSLQKNFPDFKQGDIVMAAFGTATAAAVKDAGFRLDIEAPTKESPSMASAINRYLNAVCDDEEEAAE